MIIRNDDIAFDTNINHFKIFCELCDQYNFKILQAITPLGITRPIHVKMSNKTIINMNRTACLKNNEPLLDYLLERKDLIGVHGLWHTHYPSETDIYRSNSILNNWGLKPTYFIPPFNEGNYDNTVLGLQVIAKVQNLELYLNEGTPTDPIVYLHSWRFDKSYYSLKTLECCLKRISTTTS